MYIYLYKLCMSMFNVQIYIYIKNKKFIIRSFKTLVQNRKFSSIAIKN